LVNPPLHEADVTQEELQDGSSRLTYSVTELGYGCHGNAWRLLIRERLFERRRDEYGQPEGEAIDATSPKPLLEASRNRRIQAVKAVPELVESLKNATTEALQAIEKAGKLAESSD
jgi:hypothetical protein